MTRSNSSQSLNFYLSSTLSLRVFNLAWFNRILNLKFMTRLNLSQNLIFYLSSNLSEGLQLSSVCLLPTYQFGSFTAYIVKIEIRNTEHKKKSMVLQLIALQFGEKIHSIFNTLVLYFDYKSRQQFHSRSTKMQRAVHL